LNTEGSISGGADEPFNQILEFWTALDSLLKRLHHYKIIVPVHAQTSKIGYIHIDEIPSNNSHTRTLLLFTNVNSFVFPIYSEKKNNCFVVVATLLVISNLLDHGEAQPPYQLRTQGTTAEQEVPSSSTI
jgi:hypothetical protein